jgi:hypothetical protein
MVTVSWFGLLTVFTFIFNTPHLQYTPPVSLFELQALYPKGARKTRHWADGLPISVHASKKGEWTRNEKEGSTKLVSISLK